MADLFTEAKIPTHIFSLSEKTLMEVHEEQPEALFHHNKVCAPGHVRFFF